MTEKQPFYGKLFQGFAKFAMYMMFRPKIVWKDKTLKKSAKTSPVIFVANHTSHFDGVLGGAVLGRFRTHVLVAKDQCERKGIGTLIKLCRIVQVDRYAPDADWYLTSTEVLKSGRSMLIFPEGGIARDGVMKEFKPGAALLAATTGARLVPCAISGGYHKFFGKRQRFVIGEPIEMNCPENMRHSLYAKQKIAQAQQRLSELLEESVKK